MSIKQIIVPLNAITQGGLWRLFPCIEVSRTSEIPCDYPGPMGVPITASDKILGDNRIEIVDMKKPKIGDKWLYQRIIIRNRFPELPDTVDINALLSATGSDYYVDIDFGDQC